MPENDASSMQTCEFCGKEYDSDGADCLPGDSCAGCGDHIFCPHCRRGFSGTWQCHVCKRQFCEGHESIHSSTCNQVHCDDCMAKELESPCKYCQDGHRGPDDPVCPVIETEPCQCEKVSLHRECLEKMMTLSDRAIGFCSRCGENYCAECGTVCACGVELCDSCLKDHKCDEMKKIGTINLSDNQTKHNLERSELLNFLNSIGNDENWEKLPLDVRKEIYQNNEFNQEDLNEYDIQSLVDDWWYNKTEDEKEKIRRDRDNMEYFFIE